MPKRFRKYIPNNRFLRTILGVMFVILGLFGFLPILGFWMIPLGLFILSIDFASVRRFRRRQTVYWVKWWNSRKNRK